MQLVKKAFVGIAAFLGIALAPHATMAGELQQQLTSESVIQSITKRGKMKVGMSTFVPWAMRDKKGELIGFEIDVAKKVAADLGVESLLIMVDGEGQLGHADAGERAKTVANHHKWVDAAKYLDCHSIRVNAGTTGSGSFEEKQKLAADGLRQLSEYGAQQGLNVIVENHGGLSSDGSWLAGVMKLVNLENCGTLPDFGNFNVGGGKMSDRYKGVRELMPYAKAVSAKSHEFDEKGNEVKTDYLRMMKIVLDHGFNGYVGVEYEGSKVDAYQGIKLTKALLERVRDQLS